MENVLVSNHPPTPPRNEVEVRNKRVYSYTQLGIEDNVAMVGKNIFNLCVHLFAQYEV